MNDDRWNRVKTIFHEVIGCPTQNRPDYLENACNDDAELRAEVESLLSSHNDVDSGLASPTHPLDDPHPFCSTPEASLP